MTWTRALIILIVVVALWKAPAAFGHDVRHAWESVFTFFNAL